MKKIISVIYIVTLTVLSTSAFASDFIRIHNAWIRSAPPNVKVLAAYMTITNTSTETRALTAVSSELFNKVEIHRTEMHESMAKMIPQNKLIIPADKSVSLEPGGYHLMLIEPKAVPRDGEEVNMQLHFDAGLILNIKVPVRAGGDTNYRMEKHHH